jgi:hypothetical protein
MPIPVNVTAAVKIFPRIEHMQELELIQDDELDLVSGGWSHPVIKVDLSTTNNFQHADLDASKGGTIIIGGAFTGASFS